MPEDSSSIAASAPSVGVGATGLKRRSQFGDLRLGPILSLPAVLTELGVSPERVFDVARVATELFQDAEARIAIEPLGRLLDTCVACTGCDHFGLLVGERFNLRDFGQLGSLMRHSATVGDALRDLLMHLHLADRGAAPVLLAADPSYVALGYSIYRHGTPATAQIHDGAIAIAYRILRELCGPAWQPMRVQLSHGRPANLAPYRRVFGSSVIFDADVSAVLFATSWLERPIAGADPRLHAALNRAILEATAAGPMTFAEQVQGVLHQMILSGTASAASVARLFGIHERTLRRRLEDEGKHLQQLVSEERFEIAKQLLCNTRLPVAEIAAALQYADPNAFSRAFGIWAGVSPRNWRQNHTKGNSTDITG